MTARTFHKAVALTGMILLAMPASVRASGDSHARSISGESPFVEACTPASSNAGRRHMEQETMLAVNPANPQNRAVAWIQDWSDAIVVAVTTDGGDSWRKVVPPSLNWCSGGGGFDSAINPHLAFAPDGTLYLTSLLQDSHHPTKAVVVARSTDGGVTWSAPTILEEAGPPVFLDWSWVVADPTRPATVYASWLAIDFEFGVGLDGQPYMRVTSIRMRFSRTVDGGRTWSTPRDITSAAGRYRGPSRLVVHPDGTLVNLFGDGPSCDPFPSCIKDVTLMASRSTDLGDTWSAPVPVAATGFPPGYVDSDIDRLDAPQADFPALAPDGTIHYAWSEIAPDRSSTVYLTSSRDAGRTWSDPKGIIASPVPIMNPNLAVAADGTVGLLYYDFRNDDADDDEATTDVWLATGSNARTRHWTDTHVAGPFDARTIPYDERDPFMREDTGSYQGIVGTEEGFAAAFTVARPLALAGPMDVFYAEIPGSGAAR
ncbi:MAG: sialidase family protein [Actinomycetota bacterium]